MSWLLVPPKPLDSTELYILYICLKLWKGRIDPDNLFDLTMKKGGVQFLIYVTQFMDGRGIDLFMESSFSRDMTCGEMSVSWFGQHLWNGADSDKEESMEGIGNVDSMAVNSVPNFYLFEIKNDDVD